MRFIWQVRKLWSAELRWLDPAYRAANSGFYSSLESHTVFPPRNLTHTPSLSTHRHTHTCRHLAGHQAQAWFLFVALGPISLRDLSFSPHLLHGPWCFCFKKPLWDRTFTCLQYYSQVPFPGFQYPQTHLLLCRHLKSERQAGKRKWWRLWRVRRGTQPAEQGRTQNKTTKGKFCQTKTKRKLCTDQKKKKISNSSKGFHQQSSLDFMLRWLGI